MGTSKKSPAEIDREKLNEEARIRAIENRNEIASEKLRQAQLQNNTAQEGFFRPDMNSFRYAQKDNQGGFQQAVDFGVPSNIRRVQDELEDTSQYSPRSYTPADGMEDLDSNKFLGLYGDVISRMNSLGTRAAQAGYDINNLDISDPAQAQLFKEFNTLKNFGGELGTRLQNSRRIREEELKKGNINRSSDGGRGMQTADMYFSGNKWKERSNRINGDAKALFERGAANDANKLIENYRNELRSELSNAESIGDDVLAGTLKQEIASIQDVYYDPSKANKLAFDKKKHKDDNSQVLPPLNKMLYDLSNNRGAGALNSEYNFKRTSDGGYVITSKGKDGFSMGSKDDPVFFNNDEPSLQRLGALLSRTRLAGKADYDLATLGSYWDNIGAYNPEEGVDDYKYVTTDQESWKGTGTYKLSEPNTIEVNGEEEKVTSGGAAAVVLNALSKRGYLDGSDYSFSKGKKGVIWGQGDDEKMSYKEGGEKKTKTQSDVYDLINKAINGIVYSQKGDNYRVLDEMMEDPNIAPYLELFVNKSSDKIVNDPTKYSDVTARKNPDGSVSGKTRKPASEISIDEGL